MNWKHRKKACRFLSRKKVIMNSDIKKIASLDIQILILVLYSLSFTNTKCDRNVQIQQNVRQAIAILEGREREK